MLFSSALKEKDVLRPGKIEDGPLGRATDDATDDDISNSDDDAAENDSLNEKAKNAGTKASRSWYLARVVFLDLPLFLVFTLHLTTAVVHKVNSEFLRPAVDLMAWDEERAKDEATYYERVCEPSMITTTNAEDLVLPKDVSPTHAMEHISKHGIGIIPQVFNHTTADALRKWILAENEKNPPHFDLLQKENRFSIAVRVNDDPSISQTLREIATHPVLRPALEKIVGKNPSITELSTFTTGYGAKAQHWHKDMNPIGKLKFCPSTQK